MPIEEQDSPIRVGAGKGFVADSFSDSAHYTDIFAPKEPHINPAGTYGNPGGSGVDNSRGQEKAHKPHGGKRPRA
jgi:hypothetical protein